VKACFLIAERSLSYAKVRKIIEKSELSGGKIKKTFIKALFVEAFVNILADVLISS